MCSAFSCLLPAAAASQSHPLYSSASSLASASACSSSSAPIRSSSVACPPNSGMEPAKAERWWPTAGASDGGIERKMVQSSGIQQNRACSSRIEWVAAESNRQWHACKAMGRRLAGVATPDGAVQKVVEFMDTYSLSQEDFDTIVGVSKFKGHPNPMDGIQPAVKSALTKAYKQGSSSRVVRAADLINIPGMKKLLKKRVAAILEPVEESLPEENGVASAEADEEDSSDAENNDELLHGDSKPKLDLQSDKKKGIQVQLDLKSNGNGSSAKKAPSGRPRASGSGGKAAGGSGGKRKR